MQRYKLTLEYDGASYAGWQVQADRMSVQQALEDAIEKFCGERRPTITAGRTDSGVHATAQVIHVDLPKNDDPFRVMQGINFHLVIAGHKTVAIHRAQAVDETFNARFSALRRYYRYRIIRRPARLGLDAGRALQVAGELDVEAMKTAAAQLVGHHDFSSFRDSQCQAKSPMRTLEALDINILGNEIHIETQARSFLHHQVRIMVGTLLKIGKERIKAEDMAMILAAKERAAAGPTAPPEGLYLVGVEY